MPFKFHDAHRHHFPKATYRVRNWQAYNAGLWQRGSIIFWLCPNVIDEWRSPKRTGRGHDMVYSDTSIEAMLTLGAIYHLPLRQTHGSTRACSSCWAWIFRWPAQQRCAGAARRCRSSPGPGLVLSLWIFSSTAQDWRFSVRVNGAPRSTARSVVAGRRFISAGTRRAA